MANIIIKQDPPSTPKPYLQGSGRGMPGSFYWNIGRGKEYTEGYTKAFGHKPDEFIGGRNRKEVKACRKRKCEWYSTRKRSGCVKYEDAKECNE